MIKYPRDLTSQNIVNKIQLKIRLIEAKIAKATAMPLVGNIYCIEGWEAQIAILRELIMEI